VKQEAETDGGREGGWKGGRDRGKEGRRGERGEGRLGEGREGEHPQVDGDQEKYTRETGAREMELEQRNCGTHE
jgi:hypothetical protein